MFNKRTVFIVGAGASSECGLPTGHQLKEAIAGGVRFQFDGRGLSKAIKDLLNILQARFSNVEPHVQAGSDLAKTITTFPSIDEALHWWRARTEIVELGKIAHYILNAERRCSMAPQDGQINVANYSGTWLGSFMSMALSALERGEAPKAFEQVTIINFNYDRDDRALPVLGIATACWHWSSGVRGAAQDYAPLRVNRKTRMARPGWCSIRWP
jgi:hypothetical protein